MPYARILVLALFSGLALAQTPVVTAVQNNYGRLASSDTGYGIAQGSIFIVKGTNLSSQPDTTLQNAPLQTTLAGVRVRITVAGTTYYAPLYYVLSTQIAAVLPSNVPVSANNANNATVIVEKGSVTSAAFSFKVVKSAFGMLAWDETGAGRAIIVRYPSGSIAGLSPTGNTNVLNPGDIILLFGSGLGPGPVNEDSAPPTPVDMTAIPITITIGGVNAQVLYRGRSTYVGLDQISLTVPTLSTYSCDVPMLITTNGVQANPTTIPMSATGTTCTTPQGGGGSGDGGTTGNPISQTEIDRIVAQGTYRSGKLTIARLRSFQTINGQPSNLANDSSQAAFTLQSGPDLRKQLEGQLADGTPFAPGTCKFYPNQVGLPAYNITTSYLDAGTSVTLQGPAGTRVLTKGTQTYNNSQTGNTTAGNFNDPGRYTFTAPGGKDVGAFSLSVDLPTDLIWTNRTSLAQIPRSAGATVNWSGGEPNTLVAISGFSYTTGSAQQGAFVCFSNQSAGTFTVPASILNQMPPSTGGGGMTVSGNGKSALGTAPGLDNVIASSSWTTTQTVVYQ